MAQTFEELKQKTVAELRAIAKDLDHEAVKGYSQLNKEHLLDALCQALNIERHKHHEVVGLNKTEIKSRIRNLKQKRDKALSDHDARQLKIIRRQIHHLKRRIRKSTV